MIVRNARREAIDYGPTPGLSHLALSGSICRPSPSRVANPRPKPAPDYAVKWRRMKRETDPEWAARQREYERLRAIRRREAARQESRA